MLLSVKDASGQSVSIIVSAPVAPLDGSDDIVISATSQELLPADATRSGYYFQNIGTNNMLINDLGEDANGSSSFIIPPFGTFPPCGYPPSPLAINVAGTALDRYVLRSW